MILIIVCLIVILIIFSTIKKENFEENVVTTSNLTGDIDSLKNTMEMYISELFKDFENLNGCLYSKCSIVFTEMNDLLTNATRQLMSNYYSRFMFLMHLLNNVDNISCDSMANNYSDTQFDKNTVANIISKLNNGTQMTPLVKNVLYIFELELKEFVNDYMSKIETLQTTNTFRNYVSCFCDNCIDYEKQIDHVLNKINLLAQQFKEKVKMFSINNNVHHIFNNTIENLLIEFVNIIELFYNKIKETIQTCQNLSLSQTPSYCDGPLFPPSHVTEYNGRLIYNPGNFVISQTKNNSSLEDGNVPLLYASVNGNTSARL